LHYLALLLRWWWKFKDPNYTSIWKQLVIAKYDSDTSKIQMSPIWREIYALNAIGQISYSMKVGNGMDIKIWLDR
jgi:hypothetical protein